MGCEYNLKATTAPYLRLRQLEKAVSTMQLGVTITDVAGCITYVNQAEADMHGYTVEEMVGRDARNPSDRLQVKGAIATFHQPVQSALLLASDRFCACVDCHGGLSHVLSAAIGKFFPWYCSATQFAQRPMQ